MPGGSCGPGQRSQGVWAALWVNTASASSAPDHCKEPCKVRRHAGTRGHMPDSVIWQSPSSSSIVLLAAVLHIGGLSSPKMHACIGPSRHARSTSHAAEDPSESGESLWMQVRGCVQRLLPCAAGDGTPQNHCSAPMHGAARCLCEGAPAGSAALAGAQAQRCGASMRRAFVSPVRGRCRTQGDM